MAYGSSYFLCVGGLREGLAPRLVATGLKGWSRDAAAVKKANVGSVDCDKVVIISGILWFISSRSQICLSSASDGGARSPSRAFDYVASFGFYRLLLAGLGATRMGLPLRATVVFGSVGSLDGTLAVFEGFCFLGHLY